jgi:hypothetical protein
MAKKVSCLCRYLAEMYERGVISRAHKSAIRIVSFYKPCFAVLSCTIFIVAAKNAENYYKGINQCMPR